MTSSKSSEGSHTLAGDRTHIVLVPGFVGFDALGQLEYYAGVTGEFNAWRTSSSVRAGDVAIHYFDNFPTASVEMRSRRLRSYLAKRIARGVIGAGDRIALVGHSTGGLDIRRALHDLVQEPEENVYLDNSYSVSHGDVLRRVRRIVFLSVPHYGTNIAEFACRFDHTSKNLLADADWAVELRRASLGEVRRQLLRAVPEPSSNLLLALADALNESDERAESDEDQAAEREARAQLGLWLGHMSKDFRIVQDLRVYSDAIQGSKSPAHFSRQDRAVELRAWRDYDVSTASYATMVPARYARTSEAMRRLLAMLKSAAAFVDGGSEILALLPQPASSMALGPVLLSALLLLYRDPKLLFGVCHALCADPGGPFGQLDLIATGRVAPSVTEFSSGRTIASTSIETSDSDGIVNTLSQLWPYDPERPGAHRIELVHADHGDIIGHHKLRPEPGSVSKNEFGRKYEAYDFFQSDFEFEHFSQVWRSVFDFCTDA